MKKELLQLLTGITLCTLGILGVTHSASATRTPCPEPTTTTTPTTAPPTTAAPVEVPATTEPSVSDDTPVVVDAIQVEAPAPTPQPTLAYTP